MRGRIFKKYVHGLLAVAGGALLFVIAVNALVNPFNLYDGLRIRGVNDYKYRLIKHQRLTKPAEILRLHPDCLILGTSRIQIGLDPAHPGWGQCRVYNLALNRSGIYESMRYYQHAAALQRPRKVVLELDQVYGHETTGGFEEERLLVKADGSPNPMWWRKHAYDIWTGLASLEALRASWQTVFPFYQRRSAGPEDGFWEYTPVDEKMLRHGQRNLFRKTELDAFARPRDQGRPPDFRSAAVVPRAEDSYGKGHQYLRAILRQAHLDGTQMFLIFAPQHARYWNRYLESGRWGTFEARKRMTVFINEDEARLANREPFPLWDFSGFNTYTTEPVPPADDRVTRMRWHWEGTHFTKELGDRVLDRVLGFEDSERPVSADFGVRLSSGNLEAHLSAMRVAGDRWRLMHPQDVAETARRR